MRPVTKWPVGQTNPPAGTTVLAQYNPHGQANPILQLNLDTFCSYCEAFGHDLQVEHIVSVHRDGTQRTLWGNFLLACGRCNGGDNKSSKLVDLTLLYFPHQNNTLLAFEYREGGLVGVHPGLANPDHIDKAKAMLDLVCIDKYPGNPKYPPTRYHPQGFPANDRRWAHRRTAWEKAKIRLAQYEAGEITAESVVNFAHERGFFSVWFSVFSAHQEVKGRLINAFYGTAANCFDANFNPIPRNPTNTTDPI